MTSFFQHTCQILLLCMPWVHEPFQKLGLVQLKWLFKDQCKGKHKMWAVIKHFSMVIFNFLFSGPRSHTDDPFSLSASPHVMGSWNWVFSGQAPVFLFHSLQPQSVVPWEPITLCHVLQLQYQPLTMLAKPAVPGPGMSCAFCFPEETPEVNHLPTELLRVVCRSWIWEFCS